MNKDIQNGIVSVIEKFIKIKDDKRYILESDLDSLGLNGLEKRFFENLLKQNNIDIIKTMIATKDRPTKVSEYEYGKVEKEGLISRDKPRFAEIEFDSNGNIIREDYTKLDEFLDEKFLPHNIEFKKKRISEDPTRQLHPFLQLNKVVALQLSELEMTHAMNYFKEEGITVRGKDSTIDQDFENYDYYVTYKNSILPDANVNSDALFLQYQKTNDPKIREQIILGNMRLVPWIMYKLSIKYKIDINELNSYGYEGLIEAVERFDPSLGNKFSTYAYHYIKGYALRGIGEIYGVSTAYWTADYIRCKDIVEKETGVNIETNPEIIPDIVNLMVATSNGRVTATGAEKIQDYLEMKYKEANPYLKNQTNYSDENDLNMKVESRDRKKLILSNLNTLTPREEKVIRLRFGLDGGEPMTLEEVGREFNVHRERIRQIEAKAIRKLRHPSRGRKVINYVNIDGSPYDYDLMQPDMMDFNDTDDIDYGDGNKHL